MFGECAHRLMMRTDHGEPKCQTPSLCGFGASEYGQERAPLLLTRTNTMAANVSKYFQSLST